MLVSYLLALLVVATLALIAVGAILAHQQRIEVGQRRLIDTDSSFAADNSLDFDHEATVLLGAMGAETSQTDWDLHALSKLRDEAEARRQLADIAG